MNDSGPAAATNHTSDSRTPAPKVRRIVALDVYRGLVMLILVPDVFGGFSFHRMAREFPDSAVWARLAYLFRHVPWRGGSIWDLLLPSFLFLAAAAMPLSAAARRARGATEWQIAGHVLLRATLLFVLGLLVKMPMDTELQQAWPLILIAAGLPLGEWFARLVRIGEPRTTQRLQLAWSLGVLIVCCLHIAYDVDGLGDYQFDGVFSQLALASVFVFLLIGRPVRVQLAAAAGILLAYWLLFALWPVSPVGGPGAVPGEEIASGFFAHWNKNANAAYAFETWFLNLLPRAMPFEFNQLGLVSLNFLPSIATMIFGVMAGEFLMSSRPGVEVRNTLLRWGVVGIGIGFVLGYTICPIIKILWTPSWTLLSAGVAAVVLALFYQWCDLSNRRAWTWPLVVAGTNTALIYTLATNYRWRFDTLPDRLLGFDPTTGPYAPLSEALLVGFLLWCTAFVLYKAKVFVRL